MHLLFYILCVLHKMSSILFLFSLSSIYKFLVCCIIIQYVQSGLMKDFVIFTLTGLSRLDLDLFFNFYAGFLQEKSSINLISIALSSSIPPPYIFI